MGRLAGRVIAYLGPESPHADAAGRFAARVGAGFVRLPDSVSAGCYRPGWAGRGRRAVAQVAGRVAAAHLATTLDAIDRHRVGLVLGYWGINPLTDLRAVRRRRPDLPCVLAMLCHPSALSPGRVAAQNWLLRRAGRALAGVIYPSGPMAAAGRRAFGRGGPPAAVVRPCWPAAWHATGDPEPADGPNVVFLGRMDGGQPCDDVRRLLDALAGERVRVHHVKGGAAAAHPYRVPFPPTDVPGVVAHARRFDASLVAYNSAVCRSAERFRNTVPDRLISSVAAGVPVALPRAGYDACDEYLADYPAVIRFDTPAELAAALRDRPRVAELRAAARAAQAKYRAEADDDRLAGFLADAAGWGAGSGARFDRPDA